MVFTWLIYHYTIETFLKKIKNVDVRYGNNKVHAFCYALYGIGERRALNIYTVNVNGPYNHDDVCSYYTRRKTASI